MWHMIPSLEAIVQALAPVFTQPSFTTQCQLLLAWLLCPGTHTPAASPTNPTPNRVPTPSATPWTPTTISSALRLESCQLAYRVAVLILTSLKFPGPITLLVDDTLAHKRGKSVWGLGWFRDAVASTKKRVATASGHNWVVVAVAVCVPFTKSRSCLPLLARLHLPGKGQPSCATGPPDAPQDPGVVPGPTRYWLATGLRRQGLARPRCPLTFVGRMRGDAAVYDPRVPAAKKGQRGPKPQKGRACPAPRRRPPKRTASADGRGLGVAGGDRDGVRLPTAAACVRLPGGVAGVLGLRPLRIVVVRDPRSGCRIAICSRRTCGPAWHGSSRNSLGAGPWKYCLREQTSPGH